MKAVTAEMVCLFVCLFWVSGRCPVTRPRICAVITGRGVDENHLHARGLSGSLELRQVAVVEPGRLHSLEAGRHSRVYPLAEVRQLGEEPGDVGAEAERSHPGRTCACAFTSPRSTCFKPTFLMPLVRLRLTSNTGRSNFSQRQDAA